MSTKAILAVSVVVCAALFNVPLTHADTPAPASAPANETELSATITSVKGLVQIRGSDADAWQPAKVGTKVNQGVEFRTGLRSAVQFVVEPDQVVTLDRLGTVKLLQAYMERNKVTTDLGMKYGRTRYDIQGVDLEHQSTIHSPGSTLAIRGTDVTYEDQVPWTPNAVCRHGRAEFREFTGNFVPFGHNGKAAVAANTNGPAQQALNSTRVDPRSKFAGRSTEEQDLLLNLSSRGGIDSQGQVVLQNLAKQEAFAPSFIGVPTVPGPLEFDLIWQSTSPTTPGPTNLNLVVVDPSGHPLSAAHPLDGKGTAQGMFNGNTNGSNIESAIWPDFFPLGRYKVQAVNPSSSTPAQITVIVYQGQSANPVKTFGYGNQSEIILPPGKTFTATVNTRPTGR